jgi:hypothetical protein
MPSTWLCMLRVHYQECLFVCSLSTVHCFNDVFGWLLVDEGYLLP